ncbi:unnamed protein product [Adineta steineri]|uniref:G-protein coupled receptors family 1 profile domain-containing protein n=1 Tax=Adineta steineri TaxID=433720 RepID=A0A814Y834_9BILA|nr:unnamed protein product [Adineta steineri]
MPNLILSVQECISEHPTPYWISTYTFIILIILPTILNTIFNSLIFILVRSSTRRVRTLAITGTSIVNSNYNARDIHLLKHILFISVVFLLGYVPIYTIRMLYLDADVIFWASQLIQFLPALSGLIIIVDLFWYNRDLTQYIKDSIFRCLRLNPN